MMINNNKVKGLTAREIELKIKSSIGNYWKLYYNSTFPITQPVEHVVKELQQMEEEKHD